MESPCGGDRCLRVRAWATLVRRAALALWVGLAVGAGSWALPVEVSAQLPDDLLQVQERSEALYLEGDHSTSLDLLESYLAQSGEDVDILIRAAREALVLSYLVTPEDTAKQMALRSVDFADRAVALAPDQTEPWYVLTVSRGRRALLVGQTPGAAELAGAAEGTALRLLEMEPLHPGAHNVLGRAYYEIARLGWLKRTALKVFIGGMVGRATWENAERHLRLAVEHQPERNYHHLDLGRLLLHQERWDEAIAALTTAIHTDLEVPMQEIFREEAEALYVQAVLGSRRGGPE